MLNTETITLIEPPAGLDVAGQNAWFQTLTPPQQRVRIALDVLEQLRLGLLTPMPGTYIHIPLAGRSFTGGALQPLLIETQNACDVCAKGALFAARVRGYNAFEAPDDTDTQFDRLGFGDDAVAVALNGIFSRHMLRVIENAFEGYTHNHRGSTDEERGELVAAASMYRELNAYNRMVAVMENIIQHGGDFVVPGFEPTP